MTTRLLPPDEWARLEGTEAGKVALPAAARVLVVEDEGKIVGTWVAFPKWHAECIWADPAHRGRVAVFRHLVQGMRALIHSLGDVSAVTAAMDPAVERLLKRAHAVKLPGEFYVIG